MKARPSGRTVGFCRREEMRMLKRAGNGKFLMMAVVVPILAAFMLGIGLYPMVHMEPGDVPVAVVSEDAGAFVQGQQVNAGAALAANIEKMSKGNDMIRVSLIDDANKAISQSEDGKYSAVVVIPSDFSARQLAHSAGAGEAPNIEVYINQGSYGLLGTVMESAVTQMVDQMGKAMSPDSAEPLSCDIRYINPVDNMGEGLMSVNGHALAGMITWMNMLIATVMLYMYGRRRPDPDVKPETLAGDGGGCADMADMADTEAAANLGVAADDRAMRRRTVNVQLIFSAVSSLTAAATVMIVLRYVMGFDIEPGSTFCYLMVMIFGFMMLILGIMRWLGFGGIALAALAMFTSLGTIYIPYEALPGFWQTYIYPWAPVRFIGEGFREIFFLGGSWMNAETLGALIMAAAGIALAYLSILRKGKSAASGKEAGGSGGAAGSEV